MSAGTLVTGEGFCPALLIGLADFTRPNAPSAKQEAYGALRGLLDPSNRDGNGLLQVANDPDTGHRHQARIKYKTRGIRSNVTNSKSCTTGTEKVYNEVLFEPCSYREVTVTLTYDKVRRYCEAASEFMNAPIEHRNSDGQLVREKQIMRELIFDMMLELNGLRAAISEDVLDQIIAGSGRYQDDSATKTFDVVGATNGQAVQAGINQMMKEYRDLGEQIGAPIVIANGNFSDYWRALNFACCNELGIDTSRSQTALDFGPFRYYLDQDVETTMGANQGIFFAPGSQQFVTFNENRGTFNQKLDNVWFGTFRDPVLPAINWDVRIFERGCATEQNGEGFDVKIGLTYDVFSMPQDIYAAGDRLNTASGAVNGIFQATWNAI